MSRHEANRRLFLKTTGAVFLSTALLPGCATSLSPSRSAQPRRLARVNVSWNRIIRIDVGLRPFRPAGFVVKTEQLGDKVVVHNYGHDSRGVTLSWGTAHLAMEQALKTGHTRFAVIGCGVVGLSTARLLQRQGSDVTIYAKELPPNTTSNASLAMWGHVRLPKDSTASYREQYPRAARLSHRYFQDFVGDDYGVYWTENYTSGRLDTLEDDPFRDLLTDVQEVGPNDHPFRRPGSTATPQVLRWLSLRIEPTPYLNALMRDFQLAGGRIVVREFPDVESLLTLSEPALINCTGLGSRSLFNDQELIARKGQLIVLPPQPEVDYMTDLAGDMVSRKDGVLLGSSSEEGVYSLAPNPEVTRQIMERQIEFFSRME